MISNQVNIFFVFVINGILIGLLFDFFRILRKTIKTNDFFTYIEDILFWILTGFILLFSIFIFNNGEIRLFMFWGIFIGVFIYMISISSYIIKINVTIINYIKIIAKKIVSILIIPFKFVIKIFKRALLKPITFIFINIKDISSNLYKKMKISKNKTKNLKQKEGFGNIM